MRTLCIVKHQIGGKLLIQRLPVAKELLMLVNKFFLQTALEPFNAPIDFRTARINKAVGNLLLPQRFDKLAQELTPIVCLHGTNAQRIKCLEEPQKLHTVATVAVSIRQTEGKAILQINHRIEEQFQSRIFALDGIQSQVSRLFRLGRIADALSFYP